MPKKNTTLPKLLTIRQAAEVLNVHVETLRRWDNAGKLYLETMDYFVPIKNGAPALQKQYLGLELGKKPATKAQTAALATIRAQWRRRRDSNSRVLTHNCFPSNRNGPLSDSSKSYKSLSCVPNSTNSLAFFKISLSPE